MQLPATVALMLLLIFCCVRHSSDAQCFAVGRTTSKNGLFPFGDLDLRLLHGSLCLTESPILKQHLDRFGLFRRAREHVEQTDTQTTLLRL